MQSFFYLVLNHPHVYTTLQAEIDAAQEEGGLSEIVTYAEVQKLEYFQACLKESMRLRPAVGLGIYRKVPPEGAEIGGNFYPGGTEVAVNGWVLHRDKSVFGEDVEQYRPERWFERDAKFMNSHMYQVSSSPVADAPLKLSVPLADNKYLERVVRRRQPSLYRAKPCIV